MESLVRAFLEDGVDSPIRFIGESEKGADLVRRVQRSGAEGVVFCSASFCDPALLDQPMAIRALEKAGIPRLRSSFPRTTGSFRSSASRRGPSRTPSSSGARCRTMPTRDDPPPPAGPVVHKEDSQIRRSG